MLSSWWQKQEDRLGLDRLAISLSALCLVHCLLGVTLLSMVAVAGSVFADPHIHEIGLMAALPLAALSLGRGVLRHRQITPVCIGGLGLGLMIGAISLPHGVGEVICTMIGVGLLALAHYLNRRALI